MSRLAYEAVCSERDRLRAQNDDLIEHTRRMDRIEHGVGEQPRERRELKPMPQDVKDLIAEWDSSTVRREMTRRCYRRHASGEDWEHIKESLQEQTEEETE